MESELQPLAWPARMSRVLETAWERGWTRRPPLDADAIIAAAHKRAGRVPASGLWQGRLDILCRALEQEARLTALGRTIAYGQLVRLVAARTRAEARIERAPEILQRPVAAPLFLVGQMRSGTTRMHRLLACDDHFAHTRLFETLDPVPYRHRFDRRVTSAVAAMAMMKLCNPALAAIHPISPMAPEEEFGLQAFSIWGAQFEGQWRVPSFVAHGEAAGAEEVRGAYEEFRMLLQIAGHARGIDLQRTWLLKAPQFCQDLDVIREVFPGARIIRLDREPVPVVGSGASLVWNQMRVQSDCADRAAIGAEWLRKTALRNQRLEASLGSGVEHLALDYDEVSRDWRGAVARVYDFLGRRLSARTEARMERFMRTATAHHGHRYALEAFGLDEQTVHAALA
jgi:hypothetical protein